MEWNGTCDVKDDGDETKVESIEFDSSNFLEDDPRLKFHPDSVLN